MTPRDDVPASADELLGKVTFSESDVASLRAAIRGHRSLTCPRCGRSLSWGPPAGAQTAGLTWVVHCGGCGRGLTVEDFRGMRVPR